MSEETTVTTPAPPRRSLYWRLWAQVPRDLGFLLPLLPIVIVAVAVLTSLFVTGLGLVVAIVGLFLVLATLFAARGLGFFELIRLKGTTLPPIRAPRWDRVAPDAGWLAKLIAPLIDGHYWLHLLHGMIVNPLVSLFTWTVGVTWTATALFGSTYWLYGWALDPRDRPEIGGVPGGYHPFVILVFGLGLLASLPFVTRGLAWVHWGMARGMLGAFSSEQLKQQVTHLDASRTAAVAAEGTALRRLERDIHDGPQQRLVRLQMDLAAADRQVEKDPAAARALIAEALQQSREALEELRALSRGFAPPILLDRGLVAALESLAVRSPIPVRVVDQLPEGLELPPELARNAYFVAAESLTNAAKHSGATQLEARLTLRRVLDDDQTWLDVVVSDDGDGGAVLTPGHGIAGLDERVRGLGGVLAVDSPAGGPTVISAHLPLTASTGSSIGAAP